MYRFFNAKLIILQKIFQNKDLLLHIKCVFYILYCTDGAKNVLPVVHNFYNTKNQIKYKSPTVIF